MIEVAFKFWLSYILHSINVNASNNGSSNSGSYSGNSMDGSLYWGYLIRCSKLVYKNNVSKDRLWSQLYLLPNSNQNSKMMKNTRSYYKARMHARKIPHYSALWICHDLWLLCKHIVMGERRIKVKQQRGRKSYIKRDASQKMNLWMFQKMWLVCVSAFV